METLSSSRLIGQSYAESAPFHPQDCIVYGIFRVNEPSELEETRARLKCLWRDILSKHEPGVIMVEFSDSKNVIHDDNESARINDVSNLHISDTASSPRTLQAVNLDNSHESLESVTRELSEALKSVNTKLLKQEETFSRQLLEHREESVRQLQEHKEESSRELQEHKETSSRQFREHTKQIQALQDASRASEGVVPMTFYAAILEKIGPYAPHLQDRAEIDAFRRVRNKEVHEPTWHFAVHLYKNYLQSGLASQSAFVVMKSYTLWPSDQLRHIVDFLFQVDLAEYSILELDEIIKCSYFQPTDPTMKWNAFTIMRYIVYIMTPGQRQRPNGLPGDTEADADSKWWDKEAANYSTGLFGKGLSDRKRETLRTSIRLLIKDLHTHKCAKLHQYLYSTRLTQLASSEQAAAATVKKNLVTAMNAIIAIVTERFTGGYVQVDVARNLSPSSWINSGLVESPGVKVTNLKEIMLPRFKEYLV